MQTCFILLLFVLHQLLGPVKQLQKLLSTCLLLLVCRYKPLSGISSYMMVRA